MLQIYKHIHIDHKSEYNFKRTGFSLETFALLYILHNNVTRTDDNKKKTRGRVRQIRW